MSKFDAAIRFLTALTEQPEPKHMCCTLHFTYRETDKDGFRAAICVLEAAGNFTADDLERITNTLDDFIEYTPISSYKCPGRVLKDKFIAFLKAIPALPDPVQAHVQDSKKEK